MLILFCTKLKITFLADNQDAFSPISSCHSELVQHFSGDASKQDASALQNQNAKSLHTVLSHSFPLAVDSVNPNGRFPVPKLEKV